MKEGKKRVLDGEEALAFSSELYFPIASYTIVRDEYIYQSP